MSGYDHTAAKRARRADQRAALILPRTRLGADDAAIVERLRQHGEPLTEVMRRAIRIAGGVAKR